MVESEMMIWWLLTEFEFKISHIPDWKSLSLPHHSFSLIISMGLYQIHAVTVPSNTTCVGSGSLIANLQWKISEIEVQQNRWATTKICPWTHLQTTWQTWHLLSRARSSKRSAIGFMRCITILGISFTSSIFSVPLSWPLVQVALERVVGGGVPGIGLEGCFLFFCV